MGQLDSDGKVELKRSVTYCPGDCGGEPPWTVLIGESLPDLTRATKEDSFWTNGLQSGIIQLLRRAAALKPAYISEPFSVVDIGTASAQWVERGVCPQEGAT